MRDKLVMIGAGGALLCLATLSSISCKKQEPSTSKEVPEQTRASYSDDVKKEQLDATMLAMQGRKLSSQEVKKLEEKLEANPEDIISRTSVLGWYLQNRFSSEPARKARQKHILWLIQNRPDTEIAGKPEAELDPILDKEEYYEAKKLWLEQVDKHNKNTAVIGNASNFFLIHDRDIAEELLKKAQALEPENPEWSQRLGHLYALDAHYVPAESKTVAAAKSLKQFEKSLSVTTSEREKFYKLADLVKVAFEADEIEKAETYANRLLAQAAQYKNDWNYGNAIHHGNVVLGRIALKSGNVEKAKEYLIKAGKTPGSPQLNSFGPNMALAKELLEKNEREVVIQYFQLCANFWEMGHASLKDWTALVKEGQIPDFGANLAY